MSYYITCKDELAAKHAYYLHELHPAIESSGPLANLLFRVARNDYDGSYRLKIFATVQEADRMIDALLERHNETAVKVGFKAEVIGKGANSLRRTYQIHKVTP